MGRHSERTGEVIDAIARLGLVEDADIILDVAALELSALDHDGLDLGPSLALIYDIAEHLGSRSHRSSDAQNRADALAHCFHTIYGFSDLTHDGAISVNSDMRTVLDQRCGLPIMLAILYAAAARRVGWVADPIHTPHHVILRVGDAQSGVLVDPADGGRRVEPDRLAIFKLALDNPPMEGAETAFVPMSNRSTLVRLLFNQAIVAQRQQKLNRTQVLLKRIVAIAPGFGEGWWRLASLQSSRSDFKGARHSLASMHEVTIDADRRRRIVAAMAELPS